MFVFKLVFLQRFLITATDLIVILYTVCFNTFTQCTVSLFVYSSFHKTKLSIILRLNQLMPDILIALRLNVTMLTTKLR